MALARLTIDGYGQIEINNCAFRRDGRIEAQCAPDSAVFSNIMVENGMLLAVDNVARKVTLPTDNSLPIALTYSAEHIYDERTPGLKNFALKGSEDFYPRLGYLAVGDKYTTNCISYDSAVDTGWTSESAFISALASYKEVPLYAAPGSDGSHVVSATPATEGIVLRVIEKTTMPDGTLGVKFQVYAC
jgi:hypothetical protein